MFRVLLLEDDHDLAETIGEYLTMHGIEVVHAASLQQARASYNPGFFDVLLSDYELPDGTGIEFLAEADREEAHTILWSGLDRSRELQASGLDRVSLAGKERLLEVLTGIVAMRDKAAA